MQVLIEVILPVFLVIGAGYGVTRSGYLTGAHVDGIMRFAQGFAIPCLLFAAIARLDLTTSFDPRLLTAFYTAAAICFAAGLAGARLLFRRDWEDSVAIGFVCLFSNSVLLGLPITERAFGPDALVGNYAIIAFHSPFCYALGITAMEIARSRGGGGVALARAIGRTVFRNTLIIAILLGFAVNLSGLTLPVVVDDALSLVIRAGLPAALFALGGVLVQYRPEGDLRTILFCCAVTLLLHPALMWGFGRGLGVPDDLFRSGVLTAAMAPGVNAYIFANLYGRAKRIAASTVLVATAGSVVTVWAWTTLLALG